MGVRATATLTARAVFERLPGEVRESIRRNRAMVSGLGQLKRNQAMLAQRVADLGRDREGPGAGPVDDPRFPAGVTSRVCTEAQLREPWFASWCAALGEGVRANRKLWEHAYIAHALDALDQLRPGRRGVGFGVGREPLVALFAGRGCGILATDLPNDAAGARGWANTEQHAGGLAGLAHPGICDPEQFGRRVSWRAVDMRAVPADLAGFDFCWSACSFEHLGSLEAGMEFVRRSLDTMGPGGIAVHTTELNVSAGASTIERGHTVLYRPRDLQALVAGLERDGHQVAALDLCTGTGVLDEYVDLPPYVDAPHLRLLYRNFVTTSVALVIRRGPPG